MRRIEGKIKCYGYTARQAIRPSIRTFITFFMVRHLDNLNCVVNLRKDNALRLACEEYGQGQAVEQAM